MKKLTTLLLANYLLVTLSFAQAGSSGFASLKLGAGARADAIGGAYSAVAEDATATYWNPAGLARLQNVEFFFTHTEWVEDVSHEFLSGVFPGLGGMLGFSFNSTHVPGIERRVNPSEVPIEKVEANDVSASLSYGRILSKKLSAGISVKYLYEKIYVENVSGYGLDFGFTYKPFQAPFKMAAVVQNIGAVNKLKNEEVELPQAFRLGSAYTIDFAALESAWLISVDVVKLKDADVSIFYGTEFNFKNLLAFRIGHQTGDSAKSIAAGLGFIWDRYRLDYGFIPFESNLGNSHKFSIGLIL